LGALTCAQSKVTIVTPYFLPDYALTTALNVAANSFEVGYATLGVRAATQRSLRNPVLDRSDRKTKGVDARHHKRLWW
jgi:phosphatidylserine/phosphatidylglycerophosphate/cardiolipin synthase-like enzyme